MRNGQRAFTVLLSIIIVAPLLSGCALRAQGREVEQLLIVQAMGLDRTAGGVCVSLASGADQAATGTPVRLQGSGSSVTQALARIRAGTSKEELFCSHVGHLVIGEAAAQQGLAPLMDYVCRSGDIRLSVPVYVLRGETASSAVLGVGDDSHGLGDALDAVDNELRQRGDGRVTDAAALLRQLGDCGSALVCALSLSPSAETGQTEGAPEPPRTVTASGYGVLKDERLIGWLDRGQAVAADLLTGDSGICELDVTDQAGLSVTLFLTGGHTSFLPHWDKNGGLAALELLVEVRSLLAEDTTGGTEPYYLQQALERSISERVREVLQLSRQWGCDFLGLESKLRLQEPQRFQALTPAFSERWPSLPLTISVKATFSGTGDVEGGQ